MDDVASNMRQALNVGVVMRRGAYYSYNGENLGQGRQKSMDKLIEEPAIMLAIEADVRRVIAERLQASVGGPSPVNLSGKGAVPVLGAFTRDNAGAGGLFDGEDSDLLGLPDMGDSVDEEDPPAPR